MTSPSWSVTPAFAYPGDAITYTLTFSNAGNGFAYGVLITDTMPSNVTDTHFSTSGVALTQVGSSYIWSAPSLAARENGVITITGKISQELVAGTITNNAIITTATLGANTDRNRSSARTIVNLRIVYLPLIKR